MGARQAAETSLVPVLDAEGRPTRLIPLTHLMRISLYWLGIATVWSGILDIVNGRLQFAGLASKGSEGRCALETEILGKTSATALPPPAVSIRQYTITGWGRRKPYIFIGASLDVL